MSGYPLNDAEIARALTQLPGWQVVDGKFHKDYKFANFTEAMGWMVRVAIEAEKLGHHPIWQNIYDHVSVDLLTYDLGHVISNLDAS